MDKSALRQLLAAGTWTVGELEQRNPALAAQVAALVDESRRQRLAAVVSSLPEATRTRLANVELSPNAGDARTTLRSRLHAAGVDATSADAVVERVSSFGDVASDRPLSSDPVIGQQLALARVYAITEIAGLDDARAEDVAAQALAAAALDDSMLTRLVAGGALSEPQARTVGLAAALLPLVDDNILLATAIRAEAFAALDGVRATNIGALAALTAADWERFLNANTRVLPSGVTAGQLAEVLAGRFAVMSRARAFASRFPRSETGDITARLMALQDVYARNPRVVGALFDALDISAIEPDRRSAIKARHAELATLAAAYPGLAIAAVLDDTTSDPANRAETATRRIGLLLQLLARLGDEWVLEIDLSSHDNRLVPLLRDGLSATEAEAAMVVSTLRAYQRTWAIAQDVDRTHSLVARGFGSALSIGSLGVAGFTARSGLDAASARLLWERARGAMADVALTAGAVLDVAQGQHGGLKITNPSSSVTGELTRLAGFEELFGNLAFCACTECQSILGPAAYFVDLMKYIDDHLRVAFAGHPGHPLDLPTRRPDLWELPLTCDNTNHRLATLELVTEVLENYIAHRLGYTGALADRAAIAAVVYGQALATTVDSVDQPIEIPVVRVSAYLEGLGSSRIAVANAVGATGTAVTRAALGVGERVRALIATADLDLTHLAHVYAIAFTGTAAAVGNVDASAIAAALGITRSELGQLVATNLIGVGVSIVPAKRDANSVQNDVEWLTGLSATVLDRMLRVRRLLRARLWSAADLDHACAALGITELSPSALDDLAQVVELQARLELDLTAICTICGTDGGVDGAVSRLGLLAQKLGLVPDDLARLMALTGLTALAGVRDVAAVVDASAWWQSTAYSLDDIAVATGQAPHAPARYPDPAVVATEIAAKAATSSTFVDTVFSVALGLSEQASKDMIAQNATLFVAVSGGWQLAGGDLESAVITVPPSALVPIAPMGTRRATVEEVRAALRPHRPFDAVARALGFAFGMPTEKIVGLASLAGLVPLPVPVLAAVRGDAPIAPLVSYVETLRPLVVAFADSAWDATAIEFARTHLDRFGLSALPVLAPVQLRGLHAYSDLASRAEATDLQAALSAFDGTGFPAAADDVLARAFGVRSAIIAGLRGRLNLASTAIAALVQLERAAQLARSLGIDGETLVAIAGDSYPLLWSAADALAIALAARSPDVERGAAAVDKAEQLVREAKRDALTSYLIHSIPGGTWHSIDDLYEYFLIDVAAGGCSTTSRVVAATTSAQLYVHRALMNLEDDGRPATDVEHVALRMPADAAAEWGWRKTYRVWQANRSLFLWPENYLEPDLRDDKTPLFRELEQELLQTDITDQNVLDAYTKYLAGFEEVAGLTLAGAYHQIGTSSDVLHLFGVSASDPPTYYYRTCENLRASGRDPSAAAVWSPWQKLTVQITGRKVSPIVHRGRLHVFWMDLKTRPVSRIVLGTSEFAGYTHTMSLRFTTLRPDGTWTAPQVVQLGSANPFGPGRGQVRDPLITEDGPGAASLDPQHRVQADSIDDYTLAGPNWDWCWLQSQSGGLRIQLRDFLERADLDLFKRTTVPASWPAPATPTPQLLFARNGSPWKALYAGTPFFMFWPAPGFANALIDEQRLDVLEQDSGGIKSLFRLERFTTHVASVPMGSELLAVPGSESDALIQVGNDLLHMDAGERHDGGYVVRRLGTTLVESIARRLFEDGLDSVLDTQTQLALAEAGIPIVLVWDKVLDRSNAGTLDFAGPYGGYYRELYLHIPYLIANALHSRGRFAAAQRWYHYIFDPTSTEVIDPSNVAPAEVAHRLLDRVWRCRELRGLDLAHVRDMLSDPAAIALYRRDPFNPWAIARRRPSAIQQAIVMKYVGNLLDWGDSLFAQFTMESVNEALMLYVAAAGILGRRPLALGDCAAVIGTSGVLSYSAVAPLIASSGELLVELETWILGARASRAPARGPATTTFGVQPTAVLNAVTAMARPAPTIAAGGVGAHHLPGLDGLPLLDFVEADGDGGVFRGLGWRDTRTASWGPALGNATVRTPDAMGGRTFEHAWKQDFAASAGTFGFSLLQLAPVFCVPGNAGLFGLWDRVEDRLYKIRHCQGLDGQLRELALFAPALDPADLAALEAGGFGLEDVLAAGNGNLPPYRFSYLIERAKSFAGLLSGLGGTLLAAYDRKDGEHLSRVRLTQQMNLAQMTTQALRLEIQVASAALQSVDEQVAAAEYRRDYYGGLIADGRSGWELTESVARHSASIGRAMEGGLNVMAAVLHLIPEVGSPMAMKYGGVALGNSGAQFANYASSSALLADSVAASASFEGSMARRTDGWRHQKKLAALDAKALQRQREGAKLRLDISNRALASHEKALDQLDVISELTDERFTNLGLYTWLSEQMQRQYRAAYQNALTLAKLAERAYQFERGDDSSAGLASTYWDTDHAGLLAGDKLLVDLHTLERRFLETNDRTHEIDQPVALGQMDPAALIRLRESGTCEFSLPELAFDLFYPGHYKRRIKGVRLTIPCITGPYVNVGATLELLGSKLRRTPAANQALIDVPPRRTTSIATSTAQNDGGVFEMSFRDERYLPFEGAGAVSSWRLMLPARFRPFDYATITDVIISISYTAEHDGELRARVESNNAAIEGSLLHYVQTNPLTRVLSLRQDFSAIFTRLLRSPPSTDVRFDITDRHFPLFAQGKPLTDVQAILAIRTKDNIDPSAFTLELDGAALTTWTPQARLGGLRGVELPPAFTSAIRPATHVLRVTDAGALAGASPADGALDVDKLLDVFLVIDYKL